MHHSGWVYVAFFPLLLLIAWGAVKINERVKSRASETAIAYGATCVLFLAVVGIAYRG